MINGKVVSQNSEPSRQQETKLEVIKPNVPAQFQNTAQESFSEEKVNSDKIKSVPKRRYSKRSKRIFIS
jgi:hypothetical protein